MAFDAAQATGQIGASIGAMLLLNASCQALIEVSIAPSRSPWYPVLDQELGQAEDLVVAWRQSGYRDFQDDILGTIDAAGAAFAAAQPGIDAGFAQLNQRFDGATRARIAASMNALAAPVQAMQDAIAGYLAALGKFDQALAVPAAQMNDSIARIQAEETDIAQQIATINAAIAQLQQQVQADRDAIAKAAAQRTTGIVETIFGVLLAPVTGGASLILAGIGVGTIAEAQEKVDALGTAIAQAQAQIAGEQGQLSSDQQQVATLNGLAMSIALAQGDAAAIGAALDALRTSWAVLQGEIGNAASNVAQAQDAQQAIVAQVWFDAACNAWGEIRAFVQSMRANAQPVPRIVPIGQ
jgi:predicted  nucleic acid-binding Zn-ribbon protein